MKNITIIDIAKLSNLSKSTVSRVINNDPNVSMKSREKINEIIKKYNYIPNLDARNLKNNNSKKILIITTRLDSYSETRIIRGIVNKMNWHDNINIIESNFDAKKTIDAAKEGVKSGYSKVIIFAVSQESYEELIEYEDKIIMIGQVVPNFRSYIFDDEKAVELVLNQINKNKKILYFAMDDNDYTTGFLRTKAFKKFSNSNNIVTIDELNLTTNIFTNLNIEFIESFDAIICATANYAILISYQLITNGIKNLDVYSIGTNQEIKLMFNHIGYCNLEFKGLGEKIISDIHDKSNTNEVIYGKMCYIEPNKSLK